MEATTNGKAAEADVPTPARMGQTETSTVYLAPLPVEASESRDWKVSSVHISNKLVNVVDEWP